jgi:two-component system invasion response regulator UvrY
MINIMLVDDHDLVRLGIKSLLLPFQDIKVIGEAADGEASINLIRKLKPDVILMDLKMPGIGGLEATRRILQINDRIKIIVVTSCHEDIFPSRLLRMGVAGYITKNIDANELVAAIRKVHGGQSYITPEIAQNMALHQTRDSGDNMLDKLSQRELQVMWMVINGCSVAEISEKLHLSPKTINTYRYRMHGKLDIKNDIELTHIALNYGLLDRNPILEKAEVENPSVSAEEFIAVDGSVGS